MSGLALADLPPHCPLAIDPVARAKMTDLPRHPDVPGKGFLTLGTARDERWVLYPERMNGSDPMTQVKYHRGIGNYPSAEQLRDMTELERNQFHGAVMGAELGAVWSQDLAVALIEAARRDLGIVSMDQALLEAGFSFQHDVGKDGDPTRVYSRPGTGGFFSCHASERGIWLMFEPRGKTYWHNLIILHVAQALQDGGYRPLAWPREVADPLRAMGAMVGVAVAHWEARMAAQRQPARKPKAG